MAEPTVNDSRALAVVSRIASLGSDPSRLDAVALGLVDALLERDAETLEAALHALRDARARAGGDGELVGRLDAATACAYWGLERVATPAAVTRGTQAHDFLSVLDGSPQLGSTEVGRLLELDETQVSRTGRRLLESGLATRRKVGRHVFWRLTPRGQRALVEAPAPRRSPSEEFWQEALRRGFEAAYGDQPGEPRRVDPTREHIIVCTLGLHTTRGIQATTWEEIVEKTGVPMETVRELFPTRDELFRSCGQHFMEGLRLPPADRAADVFAGAAPGGERVRRMVETVFDAYERGADGITAARRERGQVAVVREALEALDHAFDALATEALRPGRLDGSAVTSLRALTDLEVWRALRDQGATPEAAVEQASGAVERWLETRAPAV